MINLRDVTVRLVCDLRQSAEGERLILRRLIVTDRETGEDRRIWPEASGADLAGR